jgi:hypothetical protein
MVFNMAQIDPWEEYQPTTAPVGQGVIIPNAPEKPEKPREAPSGYRYSAGGNLEIIPGGPADPNAKKSGAADLTEGQSKAIDFYQRARSSQIELERLNLSPDDLIALATQEVLPSSLANRFTDTDRRLYRSAAKNFAMATLRRESGAAITPEEIRSQVTIFFPGAGADAKEIETLKRQRDLSILGLGSAAGPYGLEQANKNLQSLGFVDEQGNPIIPPTAGQDVSAETGPRGVPALQIAEGDRISTDRDIEIASLLQGAWQSGKTIEEVNALAIQLGTEPLPAATIDLLKSDTNRQIRWTPNRSGVREGAGPGMGSALAAGSIRGLTGNLAEEALALVDPAAAAKLQAAGEFAQQEYPLTTMAGEVIGGALSPLSRVGPGGTVLGEAVRGGVYGGLYGAGEAAPDAGILERALPAVVGLTTGAGTGALAQRFLGGGGGAATPSPVGGVSEEVALGQRLGELQKAMREGVGSPELEAEALDVARKLRAVQQPSYMAPSGAGMAAPVEAVAPPVAAAAPEEAAAELGTLINKASGTGGAAKNAQIKLAEQAQINPEAKAAAERLGIDVPADVFSDNPQVRAAVGLTRSLAGSEAEAGFKTAVTNAVDQADNIMREFDAQFVEGAIAPGVVSQRVKDSLTTTRKALNDQAGEIYKRVDTLVPKQTPVQMNNLRNELAVIASEVGEKGMTASEKGLMALVASKEPITYGRLAREKSQIGKAMKRQESTYGSLDEATLKRLYAALSRDQLDNVGRVAGEEVRRELRGANLIYAKERALGDRIVNAFGTDLEGGIANKMRSAITSGAKGEAGDFARLMKTVPDDLRKEVVATALASVARSTRGAEKGGFGFSEFADIYPKLRANPQVYKEIAQALGPKASDTLRDLYQVSKRITDARANVLTTGKANQALVESLNAEGIIARVMGSTAGKRAVGGAMGFVPGAGLVMPEIMEAMSRGNPDAIRAAGKMFSSPEFQGLLNDVATKGDASDRAINQVSMSKPFRSFIATIGVAGSKAKDYLKTVVKSAPATSASVIATETTGPETPMAAPTVTMPQ